MATQKIILNKTRFASERYTLLKEPMGCYGEPEGAPEHEWCIAEGIDRGNGYQGYLSIKYALDKVPYIPAEVKIKCRQILKKMGYKL